MMVWEEEREVLKGLRAGVRLKVFSNVLDMNTAIWMMGRIDEYTRDKKMKAQGKTVPRRNEWMDDLALDRFRSCFEGREVVFDRVDASGYIWRGHWVASTDDGEIRTPRYGSLSEDLEFIATSKNEDEVASRRAQLEYYLMRSSEDKDHTISFEEVFKFTYEGMNFDGDVVQVEDWCPLFNVLAYYDDEQEKWIEMTEGSFWGELKGEAA